MESTENGEAEGGSNTGKGRVMWDSKMDACSELNKKNTFAPA